MRWNSRVAVLVLCFCSVVLSISFCLYSVQSSCFAKQAELSATKCSCLNDRSSADATGGSSGKEPSGVIGEDRIRTGWQLSDEVAVEADTVLPQATVEFMSSPAAGYFSTPDDANLDKAGIAAAVTSIPCVINGKEQSYSCLKDAQNEIFLPFKAMLSKYYEVTGTIVRGTGGNQRFEWWHSVAKISRPQFRYNPRGVFGSFATYNVENRDRVKCISGIDGVPLSIQWGSKPYYYPIQVAQYGLQHYSKNLTEDPPRVEVLAGIGRVNKLLNVHSLKHLWKLPSQFVSSSSVSYWYNEATLSNDVRIVSDASLENRGVLLEFPEDRTLRVLELSVRFLSSASSFTVGVERTDTKETYSMHYLQKDDYLNAESNGPKRGGSIYYGIGSTFSVASRNSAHSRTNSTADTENSGSWRRLTRDLFTDFSKALASLSGNKKFNLLPEYIRLVSLAFRGDVMVANMSLSSSAHMSHFFDAANWLLNNQDANGAWLVPVARKIDKLLLLPVAWPSSMAQGHAMSVLCRAYVTSGDKRYLDAAIRATKVFDIAASRGGVLNKFLNQFSWYEEYPTTPGTFVLNGFIYSLIGLYDLKTVSGGDATATRLYEMGTASLKSLLPLYDTGSGSLYDLRHISLNSRINPKPARWDYHSVHIYQLLWLHSFDPDPVFNHTAERWIKYAKGEFAKHN